MSNLKVHRLTTLAVLTLGTMQLAGCVGGTTYGTEKSQEAQTLSSVYNLFAITPAKQEPIDYKARPDLVIPENKQVLPAPIDANASEQNPAWPESPEEKRARLRAKADANSSPNQIYQAVTDDDGTPLIGIQKQSSAQDDRCLDRSCKQVDPKEARKRFLAAKGQTEYSDVGAQRKFLTEPPNLYRTRSGTTPVGDYGLSQEELDRRAQAAAADKKARRERGGGS